MTQIEATSGIVAYPPLPDACAVNFDGQGIAETCVDPWDRRRSNLCR